MHDMHDLGNINSQNGLIDKIDMALGLHLLQNESNHVYRQTDEEGLVHMFWTLKENRKTHRDMKPKESMTGAPCKWTQLLCQDYICRFMERVELMGIYMFDAKSDMHIHHLHSTMLGTAEGVSYKDIWLGRMVFAHNHTDAVVYCVSHGRLCV